MNLKDVMLSERSRTRKTVQCAVHIEKHRQQACPRRESGAQWCWRWEGWEPWGRLLFVGMNIFLKLTVEELPWWSSG